MDKIFPIAKVVKDRGAAVVAKEAIVPAIAVLFMIVPQSLAYATLAGVPPIYGLYSSTLPLLVYGLFGSRIAYEDRRGQFYSQGTGL